MISDRDYMREATPAGVGLAVKLIWVLAACFIVQSVLAFHGRIDVAGALGLSHRALLEGRLWTLVTYQFLHAVPWPFHGLANGLGLYFFGRSVEERLGSRRFAWVYLLGGMLGGSLQVLVDGAFGRGATVVGASAGVCAVVATYCRLFPERDLCCGLYLIPIQVRAAILLWILVGLEAWCALFPMDGVAHLAHLGGYGTGVAAVAWLGAGEGWLRGWWKERFQRRGRVKVRVMEGGLAHGTGSAVRRAPGRPVMAGDWSREVDPILEKIAAQGIHSLTSAERATLERARKGMGGE